MKRTLFITILGIATLLSSCMREEHIDGPEKKKKEPGDVTLTLVAPGKFQGKMTRSMTVEDEEKIDAVTVLVFYHDGLYYLHKTASGSKLTEEGGFLKVTVNLPSDDQYYDLLILTNMAQNGFSEADIDAALDDTHPQGTATINNAYERLWKAGLKLGNNGWSADGDSRFVMAGVCLNQGLTPLTESIGTIHLVRSLAKVDVGTKWNSVTESWDGLSDFQIQEVYIYNANSQYTLSPNNANWDNSDADPNRHYAKVTTPTIWNFEGENGAGDYSIGKTESTALKYTVPAGAAGYEREIYIAEVENGGDTHNRPALIIKGLYKGTSYFYKMDFATTRDGRLDSYLHILRNHRYRFNITGIQGPGYPTPDEAYNSKSMNITTDIVAWDESGMNDTSYDGQYQLTVNKSEYTFYKDGDRTQILSIFSDNPRGWTIVDKPDWIIVNPVSSIVTNTSVNVDLSCTLNDTGHDRTGDFVISTGNLNKIIHVNQLADDELSIILTPDILRFKRTPSAAKSIEITTFPSGLTCNFAATDNLSWQSGGFPTTGSASTASFFPTINASGQEKIGVVTVSAIINGKVVSSNLTVIQDMEDHEFRIEHLPGNIPYYPLAGGAMNFRYYSDLSWRMGTAVANPGNMVSGYSTAEQTSSETGTPFNFTLSRNNTWADREAKFNVTSDDPEFPAGKSVTIKQTHAVPKLVLKGISNGSTIDMAGATKNVTFTHNSSWKFTADNATNYSKVVAAAKTSDNNTISNNTIKNYTNPTVDADQTITFTPVTNVVEGSPAAGTVISTLLTFTSEGHAPATPQAKQTVTLKTVTQPTFTNPEIDFAEGYKFSANGANIIFSAKSNAAWSAETSPVFGNKTQAADTYNTRTQTISVPAIGWSGNRNIKATLRYNGENKIIRNYSQTAFNVSGISNVPTSAINGSGANVTVTVTGYFPNNTQLRVVVSGTSTVVANAVNMPATGNQFNNSPASGVILAVQANAGIYERTLQIQYNKGGTWTNIGSTFKQTGEAGQTAPRITWKNGKYEITYDPTDAGLLFKFGGVVGIYSGSGRNAVLPSDNYNGSLCVPSSDIPHKLGLSITAWSSIPGQYSGAVVHTATSVKAGKGDPCRLVGKDLGKIATTAAGSLAPGDIDNGTWRLPTNAENRAFANSTNTWYASGTSPFAGVPGRNFIGGFMPAAGSRSFATGAIVNQGSTGYYWSNTPINGTTGYVLYFRSDYISGENSQDLSNGFPVRCVRQ